MPNLKQAPKLYHNKVQLHPNKKNYYSLPQELMDQIFIQLEGKCGNQIKLMCVLLGTLGDGSFGVSEAWITARTGMTQQAYNAARKALVERGWIFLEEGRIFVLPQIILSGFSYPPCATEQQKLKIREDTISRCVNDLKKLYSLQTQCETVPISKTSHPAHQSLTHGETVPILKTDYPTDFTLTHDEAVSTTHGETVPSALQAHDDTGYNIIDIHKKNNTNEILFSKENKISGKKSPAPPPHKIYGKASLSQIAALDCEKQIIDGKWLYLPDNGRYFEITSDPHYMY